jgi:hypothetical protein
MTPIKKIRVNQSILTGFVSSLCSKRLQQIMKYNLSKFLFDSFKRRRRSFQIANLIAKASKNYRNFLIIFTYDLFFRILY